MDPLKLLEALCRRHQLPLEEARALMPLVESAARASGLRRKRILQALDSALEERRAELQAERSRDASSEDERMLAQVARMLHAWGA